MISRFVKLQTTFGNSRGDMFAVYEKYDGDYMGEESSGSNDQTKRNLAAEEANEVLRDALQVRGRRNLRTRLKLFDVIRFLCGRA